MKANSRMLLVRGYVSVADLRDFLAATLSPAAIDGVVGELERRRKVIEAPLECVGRLKELFAALRKGVEPLEKTLQEVDLLTLSLQEAQAGELPQDFGGLKSYLCALLRAAGAEEKFITALEAQIDVATVACQQQELTAELMELKDKLAELLESLEELLTNWRERVEAKAKADEETFEPVRQESVREAVEALLTILATDGLLHDPRLTHSDLLPADTRSRLGEALEISFTKKSD